MTQCKFTCFKAYDISGEISVNIDEDLAYRVGRVVATLGATSYTFPNAVAQGVAGADVIMIGFHN